MTESEWLNADEPEPMLRQVRGTASERKLRLFSCACCRRIWRLLVNPWSRWAVETMERVVDGLASRQERMLAESRAGVLLRSCNDRAPESVRISGAAVHGVWAALGAAFGQQASHAAPFGAEVSPEAERKYAWQGALQAAEAMRRALVEEAPQVEQSKVAANASAEQCAILRDLFGNPFRPVVFDDTWRLWNQGIIPALAAGISEERGFERMAILGDALEEAGCPCASSARAGHEQGQTILDHLRGPGPHVRGCFALDLILSNDR
jgi:hypothetical protein